MVLYKYFPPERIDVFQDLKIRFSQPRIYNDPFELRPSPGSNITEEQFHNILPILINYYEGPPSELDKLRMITYKNFLADPSYILWLIQEIMASGSLALCLTEVRDSLLMWAHYACFHKGFVMDFDTTHQFFTCPKGDYSLRRINYQERRPAVTFPYPNPIETYFTKSLEWQYEKEWRLFRRLPDNMLPNQYLKKDCDGFPIYLFDLPMDAIKEVIIGCRMPVELRIALRALINDKLSHISIKEVTLSKNAYKLIIS